jgi:hypothetical protein
MSVLETLTEGIKERSLQNEGAALLEKWDKTGLLEGLGSDYKKNTMARLLENQASQLLKEASSMAGGDVQGFASVAFPIVRRVFGGLIANDLVSVQPMSLPSGLIFFMDFTFHTTKLMYPTAGTSVYGGGVVASAITGGVDLTFANDETSFYSLNQGYASPTGSSTTLDFSVATADQHVYVTGSVGGSGTAAGKVGNAGTTTWSNISTQDGAILSTPQEYVDYVTRMDPDLSGSDVAIFKLAGTVSPYQTVFSQINEKDFITLTPGTSLTNARFVRRLTQKDPDSTVINGLIGVATGLVAGRSAANISTSVLAVTDASWTIADDFQAGNAVGSIVGDPLWGLEGAGDTVGSYGGESVGIMPEIDIKVDSIAVTAITKKLKAKWTPELGQDLNAYHNLDAEVELTQILSEQIALEIDREILNDLVEGATAGRYFWSRSPGKFLAKRGGGEIGSTTTPPDFTGNVSEWYETLIETINDVSANIHRKTLRGGANFVVTSPEVANILEFTAGFRASVTGDADRGTVGAVKVGALSKKWDVYVDPYFPRNLVLVGRKGGSFLESGYVYAPYVPLQVTPTIFGTEDFTPRKGVMTRYAKKMVRPDMYGTVVVYDLLG